MKREWSSDGPTEITLRDVDVATIVGIGFGVGLVSGAIWGYRKGSLDEEQAMSAAALGSAALFATFLLNVEYMKRPKVVEITPEMIKEAEEDQRNWEEMEAEMDGEEPSQRALTQEEIDRIKKDHPWFGQ